MKERNLLSFQQAKWAYISMRNICMHCVLFKCLFIQFVLEEKEGKKKACMASSDNGDNQEQQHTTPEKEEFLDLNEKLVDDEVGVVPEEENSDLQEIDALKAESIIN